MLSQDTKVLAYNQYEKSDKALFIIYEDLECIIENINASKSIPQNSLWRACNEEN